MSQPTSKDVHINQPLTDISIAFLQEQEDFIARQVFPTIRVSKQSDLYYTYPKDQWFRSDMQKRAPGSESAGSGFDVSTDSYRCDVWALHKDIADQERANQDDPIDLDRDGTEFLTQQWLIREEKEFASRHFVTGQWTGSATGSDIVPGVKWDAASGDPISDIRLQARAMKRKTGRKPNTLVVSGVVHDALVDSAAILARINGGSTAGQPAMVNRELLAMIFEVDRYLVAEAVENTAKEGAAFVGADIFGGDNALLMYVEPNPGILKPSAGYTMRWSGLLGGAEGMQMSNFRMDHLKSDRLEIEAAFDMKKVASDLGVFFNDVLA